MIFDHVDWLIILRTTAWAMLALTFTCLTVAVWRNLARVLKQSSQAERIKREQAYARWAAQHRFLQADGGTATPPVSDLPHMSNPARRP